MIAMVCVSVVTTVMSIHVGFKSTKMPRWVRVLVIDCLGKCLGIHECPKSSIGSNQCYVNEACDVTSQSRDRRNKTEGDSNHSTSTSNGHGRVPIDILKGDSDAQRSLSKRFESTQITEITESLSVIRREFELKSETDELLVKWRLVSMIIDRALLLTFATFAVAVTVVLGVKVVIESGDIFRELTEDKE